MTAFILLGGYADAARAADIDLDPIVVSARRSARYAFVRRETAENTAVYTREDLRSLPAHDLGEVLAYLPGVDVNVNARLGQAASVTMQGAQSRQVLVMVDGIPFNTQLSGQANPSKIPLSAIERIEVIKGPSSSVWGSSLGGVINVITVGPDTPLVPRVALTDRFAGFGTFAHDLELSARQGRFGFYALGSYFDTDGIRPQAEADHQKAFGKMSYQLNADSQLTGEWGYTGTEAGDRYFAPFETVEQLTTYTRYGQVRWDTEADGESWNTAVKFNHQTISGETAYPSFHLTSTADSEDVYYGLSLNRSGTLRERDLWVAGMDADWHILKSRPLLPDSRSLRVVAPYTNYTVRLDRWDLTPGLRYDHNEQFGSQVSPSLGGVYHFQDARDSTAHWRAARAFNAPPLLWIYNESAQVTPNPDLKAERGMAFEGGGETHLWPSTGLSVNGYWAEIRDAIATAKVDISGVTKSRKENFEKFRRRGGEMLLHYDPFDSLRLSASGAYHHAVDLASGARVRGNGTAVQSFRWGADCRLPRGWDVHLYGRYDRWDSGADLAPNDRKPIFDFKLNKHVTAPGGRWEGDLFLNIYNLTNSKYWSNQYIPLPSRYFEGGWTIRY